MLVSVNGQLVPAAQASVSVFDRGFLFGDGVYELVRYFNGHPVAMDLHQARLARSCQLVGITGFNASLLPDICRELLEANCLRDASVYVQVTRGAGATRAHMPQPGLVPTVVAIASAAPTLEQFAQPESVSVVTMEDPRWKRCEIKTISLAGNILCLMHAQAAGAEETILLRDGMVGEGASTNVAIVHEGRVVTCPLDSAETPVLHGTMRAWLVDAARAAGVPVDVRPISQHELRAAPEVLLTSSRRLVSAVTRLDGHAVGAGVPGPVCHTLFAAMRKWCLALVSRVSAAESGGAAGAAGAVGTTGATSIGAASSARAFPSGK